MNQEEIISLIKQSKEIPTIIGLYSRFREKISDPEVSAVEITDLISSDQAVTSKILRIANSPFYGLMTRITTISHAIVVIGFNGLNHIILNTSVLNLFSQQSQDQEGFDLRQLWKHSTGTALLCKIIAKKANLRTSEEIFTSGLLHDIGKVIIYRQLPGEFAKILAEVKEKGIPIRQAEENVLGMSHAEVGGILLKEWNLPKTLIDTAAFHHNPALAKENQKACAVVQLADIICRSLEIGQGGDELIPSLDQDSWSALGLETEAIAAIIDDFSREYHTLEIFEPGK